MYWSPWVSVSSAERFVATDVKATRRPSPEMLGPIDAPFPPEFPGPSTRPHPPGAPSSLSSCAESSPWLYGQFKSPMTESRPYLVALSGRTKSRMTSS